MHFMLIPNSKAQGQLPLSQDPLYHVVFQDTFSGTTLDTSKWFTAWPWWAGKGANGNVENSCGDPSWPVPYCRQWPRDTANRKYHPSGYPHYQTLVSKAENFNDTVFVYSPCPSGACAYHGDFIGNGCFNNPNSGNWCMYDSAMPFNFSGAMLRSHYSFTDGYFEIRYRLSNYDTNKYNAFGPNFWLFGGSGHHADSAAYSEIDMFEMEGHHWTMAPNIHYRNQDSAWDPTLHTLATLFSGMQ